MISEPHPELPELLDRGEGLLDDAAITPCSPRCSLPAAQRLWPAWRDLDAWRDRVDAELPGEMSRLLPELWQLWHDHELPDEAAPEGAGPLDAAIDDRITDEGFALLLEDLYRVVFALGAGWAANRTRDT